MEILKEMEEKEKATNLAEHKVSTVVCNKHWKLSRSTIEETGVTCDEHLVQATNDNETVIKQSDDTYGDFYDIECDFETCVRCNSKLQQHNVDVEANLQKVNKTNAAHMLKLLLQRSRYGQEVRFHAQHYCLQKYLNEGYILGRECSVVFQRMKRRHGVLKDKYDTIYVYHNGTLEFSDTDKYPMICPYFNGYHKKSESEIDVDAQNTLKILFEDVVFEEYVHEGWGLIIQNLELQEELGVL